MTGQTVKTSNLGITTTLSANDRVVVLTNPASAAQTQTIAANNLASSIVGLIPYANASNAGVFKVGAGLSINVNGVLTAPVSTATANSLGVVQGDGNTVIIDSNGNIAVDYLHINSNLIPNANITYDIGSSSYKWNTIYAESIRVGSNSIVFKDNTNTNPDQTLSLANQVFYVTQGPGTNTAYNANAGFNAGGIILQNYTMQLANTQQNLVIGNPSVNTSVIINQNIKANTTITFGDNSVQNTAYKVPNVRIANVISNTVLIDFSTDNFVHIHTNQATVTANLQNLTAGKVIDLFIYNNVGGTQQFNHGVASSQAANGSSFFLCSHPLMYVKYFCLDGTANNTFVAAIVQ